MGESLAIIYLLCKGYWPIAKNIQTPFGEIDLICRKQKILVMVEVKTRIRLNDAENALHPEQLKRLVKGFIWWQGQQRTLQRWHSRLDLIAIGDRGLPHHIKDIWRGNS